MDTKIESLIADGHAARRVGDADAARKCFGAATEAARKLDDAEGNVQALRGLAQLSADSGDLQRAIRAYDDAVDVARGCANAQMLAHTLRHLADLCRRDGLIDAAEKTYAEVLAIYRSDPGTPELQLANALRGAALNRELGGSGSDAAALWREARDLYLESGIDAGIREAQAAIARCAGAEPD